MAGTAVGYAVLVIKPDLDAWRWMYATAVVPALLVTIARFFVTESANWLHSRGAIDRATVAAGGLLKRTPQYPANIVLSKQAAAGEGHGGGSFMDLFKKRYRRSPILASVPWFLQDLSTYGIGIFTPTILAAALGKEDHVRSLRDLIANDILAARGAALITALLIVGIAFAVLLADKLGRIEGRSCRDRWTAD